jgi:hypothetical protein
MTLTATELARLHRRIDRLAQETPECLTALLRLLESFDDDDEPPAPDDEPWALLPAGVA